MGLKLLQINFPFNGPWGNDASIFGTGAQTFRNSRFVVENWIENSNDGETGGIYLFEDVSSLDAFLTEHITRLKSLAI